ncbi:hypothetical protein SMU109_09657, partial [Streptococcus mutans OMZ175]
LINRIDTLPTMVNSTVIIVALGLITVLLVAGIARWIAKKKKARSLLVSKYLFF